MRGWSEWQRGLRPAREVTVAEWAADHVHLPDSPVGTRYDPDAALYAVDVLDAFQDPEVYEIAVVGATGMGKTAIFEAVSAYIVAQAPGPTLMIGSTNQKVREWMESRMLKVFERSPETSFLLPSGKRRHDKKRDRIIFRHMAYFTGGANLTNTQEKSMRYCLGDEPWEWPHGIIGELLKRHHDRWNRKALLQSQGGNVGSEWHDFARNGQQMVRHWRCPECEELFPWKWEQHVYEEVRTESGDFDWNAIRETVRFRCECGAEFRDRPADRRRLADSGVNVAELGSHVPGRVTFRVPFFWVWRIEWFEVVKEWLLAQEAKRVGNLEPLKQVLNKRFADWWEEPSDVPELRTPDDPYSKAEFHDGQKWEREQFRFLTVDVQKDHFWAVVRAWELGGASRLLWEGKLSSWEEVGYLQERMGVDNRGVFVDCGYMPDEVAKRAALNEKVVATGPRGEEKRERWNLLMGEDSRGYPVKVGKGRTVWRTYSNYVRRQTQSRIPYAYVKFSNGLAKDQLAVLMRGDGAEFGVPLDHSKAYRSQMQSEQKKEVSPGKWRWVPVSSRANNHLWDCEVMQVVAACIYKVLRGVKEE